MTLYANLQFTKNWLETSSPTTSTLTTNDMLLMGTLREVSDRMDSEFPQVPRWTYFAPYRGSRKYLVTPERVNSRLNTFRFREALLEIDATITLGTQVLTVGTDVEVWPDATQPPFYALRLIGCCRTWYDFCAGCAAPLQVTVPGVWGFQRDYASAWPTITTLTATMTNAQTTMIVASVTAADPYGIAPGINIGTLLRVDDGTDEFIEVTGINAGTLTYTVRRGVNGTTAVAHTNATAGVQAFQVETPVQIAVARQAALMYARRGKYTTMEVVSMSEVRYPQDFLTEVRAMMQGYSQGF